MFDTLPDGRAVHALDLHAGRLRARVLTLGATLQDLRLDGVAHPLVLGFNRAADYLGTGLYAGAIVGRFANRIAGGRFTLDGRSHDLDRNEGGQTCLHGGQDGTHAHLWTVLDHAPDRLHLGLILPDGHMGFTGTLRIEAILSLSGSGLTYDLSATSDAPTPCSLAPHPYFDLDGKGDIRGHVLSIAADHYLPLDHNVVPTGQIAPVQGTDFDFRTARPVWAGLDHNFCLSDAPSPLRPVARLVGSTGVAMTVQTTALGFQVYDGRHFRGETGLDGRRYGPHAGVALEPQNWPDAPNQPGFPDSILRPGQVWRCTSQFTFE